MTPPPSVGTVRHHGRIPHGVSATYTQNRSFHAGGARRRARVRWSRPIVDDSRGLLDLVCECWPLWQDRLAAVGLYGCASPPAITVEGVDDLVLVFTADLAGARP